MAGGGAPQQNQSDNSMGILWMTAAVFIAAGLVWYFFKGYIVFAYLELKLYEIKVISLFTNSLNDVATVIPTLDPRRVSFEDMVKIGQVVGNYVRIPLTILIGALAVLIYSSNSARSFKRAYSMRDLVVAEKNNWPQIAPIASLDLIKSDIDVGPWAMAMTPIQFCKKNNLLIEHKGQPQEGKTRKEWSRVQVTLKRGEANKVFTMQLGPLWQGIEKLPLHTRALFVALAARINGDAKACADYLKKINVSSATKLDFSGVTDLYRKHGECKVVQNIIHSHAYVLTVMASMLEATRQDGVQATADFLWLKPTDRRLWYMLNTVGRQTPFVEVVVHLHIG